MEHSDGYQAPLMANGKLRRGRPPGPSRKRSLQSGRFNDEMIIRFVAANPDLYQYQIAKYLSLPSASISKVRCSLRGSQRLEELKHTPEQLQGYALPLSADSDLLGGADGKITSTL